MLIGPTTPAQVAEEVRAGIAFLEEVAEVRGDLGRLGQACEELSAHHRALGICLLAEEADAEGFAHHLIQAALVRRQWLAAVGPAGEGRHRRASLVAPLLDAVATRQWRLAAELGALAPDAWLPGEEYEDDFCHADAVRRLLAGQADALAARLARWAAVLEGGTDGRLDVLRALAERDAVAFADALLGWRQAEVAQAAADLDPDGGTLLASEPTYVAGTWIAVDALAYLALAERVGVPAPAHVPGCPPLARRALASVPPFRSRGYPFVGHDVE